mmetsp:Transcript_110923/g.324475  ORF Transcript_110923/g.324475 Transcript_110923/m.324475 type:complete len:141 (+) Transcript_110923:97-519(+)
MVTSETSEGMNEEMRKADEYLRKHRILELFNDLCASVCFHKPQNVRDFLLKELELREQDGAEAGFFEEQEIIAVFNLADLMQTGIISDQQARAALASLANSQQQAEAVQALELPVEIDMTMFQQLAKQAGITSSRGLKGR